MIPLWPAPEQTVLDENGDVVPVNGISIAAMDAYYSGLKNAGLLLDYDPLDGPTPPSDIGQTQPVLAVDTDAILGTLRGYRDGAQARTTGATVTNAGDGDTWNWDEDAPGPYDADTIGPGLPGAWIRDTSSGDGNTWHDVPLDEDAFTTDLEQNSTPYYDATAGVWKTRPLPGDLPVINLADYLAVNGGNGTVDDTAAVNAWIAAAIDPDTRLARGLLYAPLPTSFFKLTSTITVQNVKGLRMFYATAGGCEFRWYGSAGGTMLELDGANDCEFAGLTLRNGNADPGTVVRVIERSGPAFFETDRCRFLDSMILSGGAQCNYAFTFEADSGEHWVNYTEFSGYRIAGLWIKAGARVHTNAMRAIGIYAANATGVFVDGGSFTGNAAAGGGGYHYGTGADIWIKSNDEPCELTAWNTENSAAMLIVGDPSSPSDTPSGPPVTMYGKRLDGAQNIAATGRFVCIYSGTPVSIESGMFTAAPGPGELPPRIYIATPNPRGLNLGQSSWFNSDGLGYSSTRTASGVGTYYLGPLEWPDTWPSPPVVPPNMQNCYEHSITQYLPVAMPAQIQMRSLQRSTAAQGRNSFFAGTVTGVTGDTLTQGWGSVPNAIDEIDTDYEANVSCRVISGPVVGVLQADIRSKAVGNVGLKFNQSLNGLTFRLTLTLVRP